MAPKTIKSSRRSAPTMPPRRAVLQNDLVHGELVEHDIGAQRTILQHTDDEVLWSLARPVVLRSRVPLMPPSEADDN